MPDSTCEFAWFRSWAAGELGLSARPDQPHLLEDRVLALARREGLTIAELASRIQTGDTALSGRCLDALTTNETSWFRDPRVFEALDSYMRGRPRDAALSVWSAACSSGQELYSLAMLARSALEDGALTRPPLLLGSDASMSMVRRAAEGRYTQDEINRGLPARFLVRFFEKSGLEWSVGDEIRSMCTFTRHNLVANEPVGLFDVILCRYMLIYIDQSSREKVLRSLGAALKPGGILVLGASELLGGDSAGFSSVRLGAGWAYSL